MPRTRKQLVRLLLSLFVVIAIGFLQSKIVPNAPVLGEQQTEQQQQPQPSLAPDEVIVEKVIDGDTIELSDGIKVRYIGIDTPETKHPDKPKQCFGEQASLRNKQLVEGKAVRLEKDVSKTDRYGRLLRYVYVGDVLVNEQLVKEGFAFARSFPPDIAKQDLFRAAEKQAQANQLGLWSRCQVENGYTK